MNDSIITDPRPLEAFKYKSFSDFKKKDIYKKLFKSIETRKRRRGRHWGFKPVIGSQNVLFLDIQQIL